MKKVAYILNLAAIFVACNDNDSVITVPLPEGTLNCTQLQKELGIDEKNWIPTKNGCALDDEGQSKAKSKMTTLK
ncbi:MAG: hypothetical protein HUK20_09505, partial [Fibrobacter sp.]|nr:hypothetical protein [Fibrobacter sp.]